MLQYKRLHRAVFEVLDDSHGDDSIGFRPRQVRYCTVQIIILRLEWVVAEAFAPFRVPPSHSVGSSLNVGAAIQSSRCQVEARDQLRRARAHVRAYRQKSLCLGSHRRAM